MQLQCCGWESPVDWVTASIIPPPSSCSIFQEGCKEAIQSYFWILGGIACGVLFVEVSECLVWVINAKLRLGFIWFDSHPSFTPVWETNSSLIYVEFAIGRHNWLESKHKISKIMIVVKI